MFNTASVPARNDLRFQSICVQKKRVKKDLDKSLGVFHCFGAGTVKFLECPNGDRI